MGSQIAVRLIVDEADDAKASAFAQTVRKYLGRYVSIVSLAAKPYWKSPQSFDVFILARPFARGNPASAFESILTSLGEGWQRHGEGDEESQWAVWNPNPGGSFRWPLVRWANVELFREAEQSN
jgi:hypothetical protein